MSMSKSMSAAITVAVAVIGLLVAVTVGTTVFDTIGQTSEDMGHKTNTEDFGVTNPNEDRVCTLDDTPVAGEPFTVRYYNGYTWSTVGAADYTLVGNVLTVDASAMS